MADNFLITGYWGEPHVTAENDRGINAAIFGAGRFVLPVGEQFRAEYIGNNTIRMYDGKLLDNGAAAGIPAGEYVDLLIANAGQGMKRNDLIVFQYEQDGSTLVESGRFVVVQGTETSGTATDPELTQEDLLSNEATFDQMALWRVSISGTAISAPVKVFSTKAVTSKDYVDAEIKSSKTYTDTEVKKASDSQTKALKTAKSEFTEALTDLSGRVTACEGTAFVLTFDPESYALSASDSVRSSLLNALRAGEVVEIEATYQTGADFSENMKLSAVADSNKYSFVLHGFDGDTDYIWMITSASILLISAIKNAHSWGFRRVLDASDDLNNLFEDGVYVYSTASRPANAPFENAAVIEVFGADSTTGQKIQRAYRYGEAGHSAFRPLYSGAWGTWAYPTVIKEETVTKTTSSVGNCSLGLNLDEYIVLAAYCVAGNTAHICVPYRANTTREWSVRVIKGGGMEALTETSVDITYFYTKRY